MLRTSWIRGCMQSRFSVGPMVQAVETMGLAGKRLRGETKVRLDRLFRAERGLVRRAFLSDDRVGMIGSHRRQHSLCFFRAPQQCKMQPHIVQCFWATWRDLDIFLALVTAAMMTAARASTRRSPARSPARSELTVMIGGGLKDGLSDMMLVCYRGSMFARLPRSVSVDVDDLKSGMMMRSVGRSEAQSVWGMFVKCGSTVLAGGTCDVRGAKAVVNSA